MTTDPCPDETVFLAIKDGDHVAAEVLAHIEACAPCQERLSQLDAAIHSLRAIVSDATILDDHDATMGKASESNATRMDDAQPNVAEDVPAVPAVITQPGRFQLIRLLGKGAFGEVHLAFDPHLDRKVAIKIAQRGMLVGKSQVDRFQREAQAAAQLRHPNIIPVYDVGQAGSMNYIVYEFVEGQSLRAVLVFRRKLEQLEAATIASKLAAALHYAHAHGIVHRDIKPDNILIDEKGEPHIADFGLAYRDEAETLRTREGMLMGTPAYMSPEQATGRSHDVDPRADIWSLGVLLQEMLTGERPFEGPLNRILSSIQKADPKPIQDASVSRDLEAVCRTCLAKNAGNRYQTAKELADDLDRWRRSEPVHVRRVGTIEKTIRWTRRSPAVAALVATVIGVLAVGLAVSGYFAVKARKEASNAARLQQEHALVQVDALRTATPESVPVIVETLWPHRDALLPELKGLLKLATLTDSEQVRVRLGLVAFSDGAADHELLMELFRDMTAAAPAEFLAIRRVLAPYADQLRGELWLQAMHDEENSAEDRFRAASALALYDPEATHWKTIADDVASQLLVGETSDVLAWTDVIRPVRVPLLPALKRIFRGGEDAEQRYRAAAVISELFHEDTKLLVEQLRVAEQRQLRPLLPKLAALPDAAELLNSALAKAEGFDESKVRERANLASALFAIGDPTALSQSMKQSRDMSTRALLVHTLGAAGVDPNRVIDALSSAEDPFVASGLALSLGEYESDRLNASHRQRLLPELLAMYRNHSDPGLHSALDWLLRIWGFSAEIAEAEETLQSAGSQTDRQWYVNRHGNTMAIVLGPVSYLMGSPDSEADRSHIEDQREVTIPHSFAIATKETTNRQFQQYREHPYNLANQKYSPDPNCPVINVSWYDAVKYCRWLSEQEGIPEDEMCFPPVDEIGPEMPLSKIDLSRTGYRLPTATEWEYACRAGSATSRHFGNQETFLPSYAWFSANSLDHTWPVGSLKPNGFGLFDMHANALEWCQNPFHRTVREGGGQDLVVEATNSSQGIEYELRGGTFLHAPAVTRSAWRDFQVASYPSYEFGLRVARTYNGEVDK